MKIAILGGGSWGTALAVHLAKNGHDIKVWEFFEEQAQQMQTDRVCKLLPEIKLQDNIFISHQMDQVINDTELVLLVVPSDKAAITIKSASTYLNNQPIIICSKGFADNLRLLTDVVKEYSNEVYCLYGPTHAEEICKGMFSGIVLAGNGNLENMKKVIESDYLKVDLSDDLVGVQVASALKNILAVFAGVLDGMKLGDNAQAYLMTKGLEEIKQVGLAWGAKEETFYGLAGIGDIIVTCSSKHSRNRSLGNEIGKGRKLDEVIEGMSMVAEGVNTAKLIPEIINKFNIKIPLMSGLYDILFNGKDPKEIINEI
jgi:glycerol-3-phosphate dehydrogenase (NAD(P)+)